MPGSVDNPVRIGPFRRIVEVGWPGVIALKFRAEASYPTTAGISCSPSLGDWPDDETNTAGFITHSFVLYVNGDQPESSWFWQNGEWHIAAATVEGTLPGQTLEPVADWSWFAASSPHQQANPGGSLVVSAYPVPDDVGGTFSHGTSIGLDFLAHELSGSPQCFGSVMGGTAILWTPMATTASVLRTVALDFSPIVATQESKAYRPVATRMVDQPAVGTGWVDIYVLCKRSPADDPTA